jgi:membrane protein DedA with SNARE-associated domain
MLSNQHWLAKLGNSANALITSFGGLGMLFMAIGDSSFLSIPEGNDVLIVVLSTGRTWGHMAYFVGMTIIGSVIGCMLLYTVGRKGGNPLLRRRFSQQSIEHAEKLFKRYGILSVMIPSILPPPMPFKIFVLSAGVFRLNAMAFLTAVVIGRTIRYSTWGILAVLYGNSVKLYMQHHLHSIGMVLCGGFVLAVAATSAYYLRHMKQGRGEKAS